MPSWRARSRVDGISAPGAARRRGSRRAAAPRSARRACAARRGRPRAGALPSDWYRPRPRKWHWYLHQWTVASPACSPPLSIIARLPLAMFSIALLVHAQRLTGSFAAAGLVTAAYAIALGVGGPLLGRVVDRRGQTAVLAVSASVSLALLFVVCADSGPAAGVLVALAAGIGLRDAARRRLRALAAARPARVRRRGVRRRAVAGSSGRRSRSGWARCSRPAPPCGRGRAAAGRDGRVRRAPASRAWRPQPRARARGR